MGNQGMNKLIRECQYNDQLKNPGRSDGNTSLNSDAKTQVDIMVAARKAKVTLKKLYADCGWHLNLDECHEEGMCDYYDRCWGKMACALLRVRFPEKSKELYKESYKGRRNLLDHLKKVNLSDTKF